MPFSTVSFVLLLPHMLHPVLYYNSLIKGLIFCLACLVSGVLESSFLVGTARSYDSGKNYIHTHRQEAAGAGLKRLQSDVDWNKTLKGL